jgi:hypothetical protein
MNDIQEIIIGIQATGSRVICNPPPMDTDEDFVVLARGEAKDILQFMVDHGYTKDGGEAYNSSKELDDGGFASFRKGTLNYIIVTSPETFHQLRLATELATVMNLQVKEDRIKMFQWFRDDYIP